MEETKMNTKKINKYFMSLSVAEQIYTHYTVDIVIKISQIKRTYNVSDDEICNRCGVASIQHKSFIKGAFNYSLEHLSKLQCYADELSKKL